MKAANPSTILLLIALFVPKIEAKEEFVKLIPNAAHVSGATAIGHKDNTGKSSANNDFGKAFDDAGLVWSLDLCQADTDGDGQTNGQELGDPCCEWTVGSTPRWQTGVSHPSDATKTSNESLWASIDCSKVTKISATSAAITTNTTPLSLLSITTVGIAAILNFA